MLLDKSWIDAIKKCLEIKEHLKSAVISLDPKQLFYDAKDVYSYFTPSLLFWDPVSLALKNKPVICPEHGSELEATHRWLDSNTDNSRQPRILIDNAGPKLLIPRIYKCRLGDHEIRTTNDVLSKQCGTNANDIIITHKGAFKSEFVHSLCQYLASGLSFPQMVELLRGQTKSNFDIQKQKYEQECLLQDRKPEYQKLESILLGILGMLPSVDAIEDLFKAWFRLNKSLYTDSMKSLPTKILTIDHTFKVTSNVGMFRQGDSKKWVKLYNSLFVALNERKQIVTWHFTKAEKFSLIKEVLENLKERENFKIEMVLLDNCCKYDLVIKDIFGNQIFIKLDPFHGLQRITSTIRKKHPFHQQLCNDLHNLLRNPTDLSSKRRTEETASKEIIMERLDRIIAKWESLEYMLDERSLITVETREAILNLRKHISKGCLSQIPAGCSTSANENLHKYLNKLMKGHSMGSELAEALFTIFFHHWNERIGMEHCANNQTSEVFGFGGSSQQKSSNQNVNFEGKYVQSKSTDDGNCILVKKIYMYRKLKTVYDCKYLIDIVSNQSETIRLLTLPGSEDILASNINAFGYELSGDRSDFVHILALEALKLVKKNHDESLVGYFNSKKITKESSVQNVKEIFQSVSRSADIQKLVNFISVGLIVYTGFADVPVITILPVTCVSMKTSIHIAYLDQLFYPCDERINEGPSLKKAKTGPCNCGKPNSDRKYCCEAFSYKTRCGCFNSGTGCSGCNCRCCGNPFGINQGDPIKKSRKRSKPQLSTKRITTAEHLTCVGEEARKGPWSDVEILLLYELIDKYGKYSLSKILKTFNLHASELKRLSYQIDTKSTNELSAKISRSESSREWFSGVLKSLLS